MNVENLAVAIRKEAALLRELGDHRAARLARRYAKQLEDAIAADTMEPLTPKQAAEEGGYTEGAIRDLLRGHPELNVGKKGSPMILRAHVPIKPGHRKVAPKAVDDKPSSGSLARRAARITSKAQ